ncbi:MAG: hypothetical protein JRN62_06895 [Nitrososphaerota archaeon]|jgi:dihydrolipoamide dehydrogenase|nr:hypothetical protein [Nitrososphaerota archaeon]
MGSKVTIIGRDPQFLPGEEPEVSALAAAELGKHMRIISDREVRAADRVGARKRLHAIDRATGKEVVVEAEEVMIASGRGPTTAILYPDGPASGPRRMDG